MDTRIWSKTSVFVAVIAAVLAVLWAPAAAAPPDDITYYRLPDPHSGGGAIASGPDGNMWFTDGGRIGRITPIGAITEYPLPAESDSDGIAAGPDGSMWFTEPGANQIGRITPTGAITEYPLPTAYSYISGITAGPDGNMWFTELAGNRIGRITPAGAITEYPLPTVDSGPHRIAAGPDGNLWFAESRRRIGRITPAGAFTEFRVPASAESIAAGPDGNLWFTSLPAIGRITPTGAVTEYPLPVRSGEGRGIAAGPDGNLWFTTGTNDGDGDSMIGRITPRGWITVLPSSATDIAAGPDGNLWFTTTNAGIGRIAPTATLMVVKRACPVRMTLHMPTPRKIGSRVFTDRIMTKKSSCVLRKPVVRVRLEDPSESTSGAKKPGFDTKINKYGKIRVITKGHGDLYVTVIVRAYPKRGFADRWKRGTWHKTWYLWRL